MTDYTAKITALEEAIANGEKRVESEGEMLMYQDTGEMLKALAYFRAQQAAAAATASNPAPNVTLAVFGCG